MGTGADVATVVGSPRGRHGPPAPTRPSIARNPLRWFVFAVVIAANIMDLMDATIVNVAGPSIRLALGGSVSTLQWLSAGYTLAFAIFLITGARLGDMFGRRRLFLIGSAGFTVMSAACAAAPSSAALIAFPGAAGRVRRADDPAGVRDAQRVVRRRRNEQGVRRLRPDDGPFDLGCADPRRRAGGGEPVGHRLAAGVPDQRTDRYRRVRGGRAGAAANRCPSWNPARYRRDGVRSGWR